MKKILTLIIGLAGFSNLVANFSTFDFDQTEPSRQQLLNLITLIAKENKSNSNQNDFFQGYFQDFGQSPFEQNEVNQLLKFQAEKLGINEETLGEILKTVSHINFESESNQFQTLFDTAYQTTNANQNSNLSTKDLIICLMMTMSETKSNNDQLNYYLN